MDFSTIKSITIPEGKVSKILFNGNVLWTGARLPREYQEVAYLTADNATSTYIDLGFTFDTKAKIYMEQWINSTSATTYPFGATESSGTIRCCLSAPYSGNATLYGSTGSGYLSRAATIYGGRNEYILTVEKGNLHIQNLTTGYNGAAQTSQGEYTMTSNLYLFAQNYNGSPRFGNIRQIGYFKYYDKNNELICDLIPCFRKSDYKPGMYDCARKIFLTNVGTTEFTPGPVVNIEDLRDISLVPSSIDATGAIYNTTGYKVGYRIRSGGAESEQTNSLCTGYIPLKRGETLRVYPPFFGLASIDAINFSDANFSNLGQTTGDSSGGFDKMGNTTYGICANNVAAYRPTVINGVSTLTLGDNTDSRIAYVRITHRVTELSDPSDLIVTVNREIL